MFNSLVLGQIYACGVIIVGVQEYDAAEAMVGYISSAEKGR